MSCPSCPCQFDWPVDTLGYKRDPINCEKAWLDFAVRLLSREAVGKGRGQETVWSARCKPQWWDSAVLHLWKNPTANPKDTKEVLLDKFEALEKQLRAENRFPLELEEECRLWKEGKCRELFLLTSLVSLLGKVTNVHSAVEEACVKVKDLKATVNLSILTNIQNCLAASMTKTKELANCATSRGNDRSSKRRLASSGKENSECSPTKQGKIETADTPGSHFIPLYGPSVEAVTDVGKKPEEIMALAHKLLFKRKKLTKKSTARSNSTTSLKKISPILPKPSTTASQTSTSLGTKTPSNSLSYDEKSLSSSPSVCMTVSAEQLAKLLCQSSVPLVTQSRDNNFILVEPAPSAPTSTSPNSELSNTAIDPAPLERNLKEPNMPSSIRIIPLAEERSETSQVTSASEELHCLTPIVPLQAFDQYMSGRNGMLSGTPPICSDTLESSNISPAHFDFLDDLEEMETFWDGILNGSALIDNEQEKKTLHKNDAVCGHQNVGPESDREAFSIENLQPSLATIGNNHHGTGLECSHSLDNIDQSYHRIKSGRADSSDSENTPSAGSDTGYVSGGSPLWVDTSPMAYEKDLSIMLHNDDLLDNFFFE